MAISTTAKVIIALIVVGVIAGMTATIVLIVNSESVIQPPTSTTALSTDEPEVTEPPIEEIDDGSLRVGVGIADMTGPCVEIAFMGYAEVSQRGQGIHTRQYSRAFIFAKGDTRVVLVTADVQAVGIAVRREVVKNLQELYGDMYSLRNVILTGTHTHSAPGGHLVDFLLDITILGFSTETYNAYVSGITKSIIRAHDNTVPAKLFFGTTRVANAHMNRSPYSYEYNPPEERERYDGNTDDILTQVRILTTNGDLHGVLNWFSVHTTSMNMTNHLISSDNLGYAALQLEKTLNPNSQTGKPEIVTGFFIASHGDVSPNIRGARCEFSGEECDNHFLLCEALERCYSLGPGEDMFESTRLIGKAVFEGALEVLNSPGEELAGDIGVVHQFVEMAEETVPRYDPVNREFIMNEPVSGCVPAMGYSFASGTVDGANTLNITQGTIVGNPLLDAISGVVGQATDEDITCHAPKPILLATGRASFPFPWHPRIVSVSIIWLGDLVIAGVPGEPTTMAGRRIKDVIGSVMERHAFEPKVVISSLSNEYFHYVSTYEEYQVQRYEAASTIYGPHTLDILLNKYQELTTVFIEEGDVEPGPEPADNRNRTLSIILPVIFDSSPIGRSFGDVLEQPPSTARKGETVAATFVAANPRNDLRHDDTYAVIERLDIGQWTVVATDSDWETRFHWSRLSTILGTSQATFEWTIPADSLSAQYRIVYFGTAISIGGTLTQFRGESNAFNVVD